MTEPNDQSALAEEDIAGLFKARSSMYGLMASIFRKELDLSEINELKRMQFPSGTGNESLDKGFRLMYDYLKGAWEGSETELRVDYARTFIGSGVSGYSAAYLYESVYTSERRLLGREARGEVLELYRKNGLVKGSWNDMEDHLALELEFMQIMSSRAAEAIEADDENAFFSSVRCQNDFVRDHLNNWLPMFAGDVLKFSETDFYKGIALVALGYCEDDEPLLREILESISETPVETSVA